MPQLSKKTQRFLSREGVDPQEEQTVQKSLKPIPNSADRIIPGDILIFRYYLGIGEGSRAQRVVLIVRCGRGAGVFPGRDGKLVSCFKFEFLSEPVIDVLLKNLYNRRQKSSIGETTKYIMKVQKSLEKLTGAKNIEDNNFRTYKLNNMKSIFKLYLEK